MASPENEKYWKESARLKEKNARRAQRRANNPGVKNPRSQSKKKENK
jgi:hypothetical protein